MLQSWSWWKVGESGRATDGEMYHTVFTGPSPPCYHNHHNQRRKLPQHLREHLYSAICGLPSVLRAPPELSHGCYASQTPPLRMYPSHSFSTCAAATPSASAPSMFPGSLAATTDYLWASDVHSLATHSPSPNQLPVGVFPLDWCTCEST